MQELLEEKQKADEEAEAASKNTVIKVLMGEVQVTIYNIIRYSIINRNFFYELRPRIFDDNASSFRLVLLLKLPKLP